MTTIEREPETTELYPDHFEPPHGPAWRVVFGPGLFRGLWLAAAFFGAGAMLAMAHDVRVMRADRGFFCFPEVDIRIPFTDGMAALIQAKLTPRAGVASMTTGRRFGGVEAAELGIVDATAGEGAVTAAATELLRPLAGKDPGTLGAIKRTMFRTAAQALTNP